MIKKCKEGIEITLFGPFCFHFAWYDFWIGLYWDRKKKILYFFPFPMFGFSMDLKECF